MPESLALHPDQPEVAARRAIRDVAFVDTASRAAEVAQAERDRGADQSAADDDDVERRVVIAHPTPAKRRIAGICAANSVNV